MNRSVVSDLCLVCQHRQGVHVSIPADPWCVECDKATTRHAFAGPPLNPCDCCGEREAELCDTCAETVIATRMGIAGGEKGGRRRAEVLSPERRSEIARIAANKRWGQNA